MLVSRTSLFSKNEKNKTNLFALTFFLQGNPLWSWKSIAGLPRGCASWRARPFSCRAGPTPGSVAPAKRYELFVKLPPVEKGSAVSGRFRFSGTLCSDNEIPTRLSKGCLRDGELDELGGAALDGFGAAFRRDGRGAAASGFLGERALRAVTVAQAVAHAAERPQRSRQVTVVREVLRRVVRRRLRNFQALKTHSRCGLGSVPRVARDYV